MYGPRCVRISLLGAQSSPCVAVSESCTSGESTRTRWRALGGLHPTSRACACAIGWLLSAHAITQLASGFYRKDDLTYGSTNGDVQLLDGSESVWVDDNDVVELQALEA